MGADARHFRRICRNQQQKQLNDGNKEDLHDGQSKEGTQTLVFVDEWSWSYSIIPLLMN
jgi:hypothetical protein